MDNLEDIFTRMIFFNMSKGITKTEQSRCVGEKTHRFIVVEVPNDQVTRSLVCQTRLNVRVTTKMDAPFLSVAAAPTCGAENLAQKMPTGCTIPGMSEPKSDPWHRETGQH